MANQQRHWPVSPSSAEMFNQHQDETWLLINRYLFGELICPLLNWAQPRDNFNSQCDHVIELNFPVLFLEFCRWRAGVHVIREDICILDGWGFGDYLPDWAGWRHVTLNLLIFCCYIKVPYNIYSIRVDSLRFFSDSWEYYYVTSTAPLINFLYFFLSNNE